MKKIKVLTVAIVLSSFITPMIPVNASVIPKPVYNSNGQVVGATKALPTPLPAIPATEINLPADYNILDTLEVDVTGDGIADKIYLAGHKIPSNLPAAKDLSVTVKSGADESLTTYWLDKVGGYQPHLFAGDFTGDKIADVYVETASGGSGGWSYHNIVSFNGSEPKELFGIKDNNANNITGKFVDGWKVALTNTTDETTLTVGVSERREDYLRLGIYDKEGKVQKETQIMSAPFIKLEPIDIDNDGVYELKGMQSLSGAYRADRLAEVETILKYTGINWQSQSTLIMASSMTSGDSINALAEESVTNVANQMDGNIANNIISSKGEIKEINSKRIRIVGEGSYKDIVLNSNDTTNIVSAENGTPIEFQDLKPGDAVTAYYGPMVTKSMPPQGNAIALIVGTPAKGSAGMYMKVANVKENQDGSVQVLCTNGDRLVTISPDVFEQTTAIKEGSELVVWYDVMTMSMPGQAKATKVVLLPARADIKVHVGAGVISVNGRELALDKDDSIITRGNIVMLPLRVIAESLGYDVIWDGGQNAVELRNAMNSTATMRIGSKNYEKSKSTIQLDYAPELVNEKTLVPAEFFTNVLQLKVEISNSHV
ncbi:stalk domain-containing protein [Sporomusa sp. KB1]|uniref:stalk domain-containing protein n=1 Tax=Sporomusa sp. KB1 TaxID=943346 RepID=UPI0011A1F3CE|nr:stalk domain-containing protein [Sporomusa sp. KB1]TWH51956.1 copper amine oxidase-like protein [Sporomusa sp. KB1]